MAVDTRAKRVAVLEHGYGSPYTPTGTVDAAGRGTIVGLYGSLVSPPVVTHPIIVLTPSSLTFNATTGGANPASQPVAITNGGDGTLSPTLGAIVENNGSGWLGGSVLGSTLTVTSTTGALAQGTYTGTVGVASSGADNTPQLVTVTFTVADATTPGDPPRSQHGLISRFSRF